MPTLEEILPSLLARMDRVAQTLEGEGHYNVAKLARAAGASLIRSTAYDRDVPHQNEGLAKEVREIADQLQAIMQDGSLVKALRTGADAVAERRFMFLAEAPHPYVCRTCGHVELRPPGGSCPQCSAHPRTFERFPSVYWFDAMEPMEAIGWLARTPNEVKKLIEGVPEEVLSREVGEHEWNARDALMHLRDSQGILDFRVNLLLEKENPTFESLAVFEWAQDESTRPPSALEIFDTYHKSRLKTLETLETIPLSAWWREGVHEEFGTISLKQQVSYLATHEFTHLPQLEASIERPAQT